MGSERICSSYGLGSLGDINFLQFCTMLLRRRGLITIVTLIFLLLGVSYSYVSPSMYRAKAYLVPAPITFFSELSPFIEMIEDKFYLTEFAFELTRQKFSSEETKKALVTSVSTISYLQEAFPYTTYNEKIERIEQQMYVSFSGKKKDESIVVSLEWTDPHQAAEIVNLWVDIAKSSAKEDFVRIIKAEINNQIKLLNNKIDKKKKLEVNKLNYELIPLKEAIEISGGLGFVDPVNIATEEFVKGSANFFKIMKLRPNNLMGRNVFGSEISILKQRENNPERYAEELISLVEELEILKDSMLLNTFDMETVKISAPAVASEKKISPSEISIILAVLLLGIVVGVFLAAILVVVESFRFDHD